MVGGGDSAIEEATFLTKFARKVTIIHRRDELRASQDHAGPGLRQPQDRVPLEHRSSRLSRRHEARRASGRAHRQTGERDRRSPVTGLFVAIGHKPNTDLFKGQLDMEDNGYLVTEPGSSRTNVEGVFACGDVQDDVYRQAITAAGSGCMAAIDAERWLEAQDSTD